MEAIPLSTKLKYQIAHATSGRLTLREAEYALEKARREGFSDRAVVRTDYDIRNAVDRVLVEEVR